VETHAPDQRPAGGVQSLRTQIYIPQFHSIYLNERRGLGAMGKLQTLLAVDSIFPVWIRRYLSPCIVPMSTT